MKKLLCIIFAFVTTAALAGGSMGGGTPPMLARDEYLLGAAAELQLRPEIVRPELYTRAKLRLSTQPAILMKLESGEELQVKRVANDMIIDAGETRLLVPGDVSE